MALKLYVRGAAGNVAIPDLGITVAQGPSWTQLNYSSPADAEGDSGQFTARELRDSGDLYDLVIAGTLEWSKDGSNVETAGDYKADYMITEDFTDDRFNLENGEFIFPHSDTLPASGVEGQAYWDNDDDTLYVWNGTQWDTVGGDPEDHGNLLGLGDDDHSRYFDLTGDKFRNVVSSADGVTWNGDFDAASGILTIPHAADVAGTFTSAGEGDIAWDSDDDLPYWHDGTNWVSILTVLSGVLDHDTLLNVGTNTHSEIDSHIADSTIHFTEGSIDHGSISGLGDDDHSQYLLLSGDLGRNVITGGIDASTASGLIVPQGTGTAGQTPTEGNLFWDTDDDALYMYDGSQWITIATSSGVNTDHGALTGLLDDDHTQYLTEGRHDSLPADNPHSVTFTQAVTADSGTDITAAEAETLTDGSNADSLHEHDHGALSGLNDDDHSQYVTLTGDRTRNNITGSLDLSGGDYFVLPQASDVTNTFTSGEEGALAWDTDDDVLYAHNGTQWFGIAPASGIITDHGALTGLSDDDHPQYTDWTHNETISGVWTFDPADTEPNLILDPRSSAPTNNLVDGAISVVGGILYAYDGTRSKWLSVDRVHYAGGRNSNATNIYLRIADGIATSATGIRILRDGTITGLFAQTEDSESWTFEVRNAAGSVIASLVISAAEGGQATNTDVNVSAGDEIRLYVNGSNISRPHAGFEVAWRI